MALLEVHLGSEQVANPNQVAPFEPHSADYPALLIAGAESGANTRAAELFNQFASDFLSKPQSNISEEIAGLGIRGALANHHLIRNSVAGSYLVHVDCAPNSENQVVTMDLKRGEGPMRWHIVQRMVRHLPTRARIDVLGLQSQPEHGADGVQTAKIILSMNPQKPDRMEFGNESKAYKMSDVYELVDRVTMFRSNPDRVDAQAIYLRAGHLSLLN